MNIKTVLNRSIYLMFAIITLSSLGSCEEDLAHNGLSDPNVDASFTITPVAGSANKFILAAQTKDVLGSKWDLGDGAGLNAGKFTQEIFVPDAGTYTITHIAVGKGGLQNTVTKDLVVATSDPVAGNLLKGGKLLNAEDWGKWTVLDPTAGGASIVFGEGYALVTATGWAQHTVYQSVNVVAGQKYMIDMVTGSTTGCSETWFEVYVGYSAPVVGSEYKEGGILRSLNTWDGCATAAFSGKISAVGCKADNNKGIFTATKTGVAYFVIRTGGNDMKAGIKFSNIELRPSL